LWVLQASAALQFSQSQGFRGRSEEVGFLLSLGLGIFSFLITFSLIYTIACPPRSIKVRPITFQKPNTPKKEKTV
jgi:hypothetical protein